MYEHLGKKVKKLRLKNNITQQELASVLDVSRVQISNVESGRRGLNLEQLNILCKYFKIDLSYFVSDDITDEGEKLIEKANLIFNSDELTDNIKEDIFSSILKIYMDSKERK